MTSYTPRTWYAGLAGLVSGPRMLNTVLNPSSFLMGPTYFIEEWYLWANMKQIPGSSRSFTALSGGWSRLIPRASRQSAAPDFEEAARLPCLATLVPPAEMTKAEVVEMLNVLEPSPPVPTMSRTL